MGKTSRPQQGPGSPRSVPKIPVMAGGQGVGAQTRTAKKTRARRDPTGSQRRRRPPTERSQTDGKTADRPDKPPPTKTDDRRQADRPTSHQARRATARRTADQARRADRPKNRDGRGPCPAAPSHPANLRHRGWRRRRWCRRRGAERSPGPATGHAASAAARRSGAWDTRRTGRHRRGTGRGGGRRGASARGRDGVCRRDYRSRALQRYRSHPSPCRWSWAHRSGSGEP